MPLLKRAERADGIANYYQGRVFLPGVASLVYVSDWALPPQGLIGVGIPPMRSMSPLQPPQSYAENRAGIIAGMRLALGGIRINPPIGADNG